MAESSWKSEKPPHGCENSLCRPLVLRSVTNEVAVCILGKAFQRYGASGGIADEAFPLVAPMRRDPGVGVQRKPVDAGTAGARECGMFPFIPKARSNPSHLLSGPLPKGNALLHGGCRGAGERGCVAHEGIIP